MIATVASKVAQAHVGMESEWAEFEKKNQYPAVWKCFVVTFDNKSYTQHAVKTSKYTQHKTKVTHNM